MNAPSDDLPERLGEIRGRIAAAAARAGRAPGSVRLVGVVKTVPVESIRRAIDAGLEDLGENRVQEAERAIAELGRPRVTWHLIGHLQRNKSGRAIELFDRVHTVDSFELGRQLSRLAETRRGRLPALVQVNVSSESSKSGVSPERLPELLERLEGLPGLALDGLMAIGSPVEDPDDARPEFAWLRELRDAAERALGRALPELSMGMSGDYEVAVEEGSTLVRVGSALFGARPAPGR